MKKKKRTYKDVMGTILLGRVGLAEVRLWHWCKVLEARDQQRTANKMGDFGVSLDARAEKQATRHMLAVQALNDVLPNTTADADLASILSRMSPPPTSEKQS